MDKAEQAQKLFQEGRLDDAIEILTELHESSSTEGLHAVNLCYLFFQQGKTDKALEYGKIGANRCPNNPLAYLNYGNALLRSGQINDCAKILTKGLELDNTNPSLWTDLGLVKQETGNVTEAIACHRKALSLAPNMVEALCNLGLAKLSALEVHSAVRHFERALEINENFLPALSNLLMTQQYLPTTLISKKAMSLKATQCYTDKTKTRGPENFHCPGDIIKIGFVSSDFYRHPVGYFLHGLFALPRNSNIRYVCFANLLKIDDLTETIKADADEWFEIGTLADAEVIALVRRQEIDVLIDLNGHTSGNRLGVFAGRAAPCQASWLGFFASTGLPAMDYALLSKLQAPEGTDLYYTEKLATLSSNQFNYLPASDHPEKPEPAFDKTGYIRFGCFNNPAKISEHVIRTWSRILKSVPGSRLTLKWKSFNDPSIQQKVLRMFARHGIDEANIELRAFSPHREMMQEYHDIDIALDTFPFSGALTTCEALWMGVPVITLEQLRPVSRQSSAILKSLELDHLVSSTPNGYLKIACDLAADIDQLRRLKTSLRGKVLKSSNSQLQSLAREIEHFAKKQTVDRTTLT